MGRAVPLPDPTALVGVSLTGGYRIVRLLDAAGFGAVFEAVGPAGRRVALKVLVSEVVTEDTLSRLSREASVTSKIDNGHVVPIIDAGQDLERDLAYLVMPLLDGVDVAALLADTGPLSPDVAVRIALQIAAGLSAGHAAGVVYRDVRPSRVFLERKPDGEMAVRVFGFGLSKGYDQAVSNPGKARSTGQHRAESEQRDDAADVRVDVFGLAATLYEMLCGVSPWAAFDVTPDTAAFGPGDEAAESQRSGSVQLPSIQDRAPWIHARLATALAPALNADVDRRYPSIDAFAEALRALGPGDERLTADMLEPLDPELRAAIAERADAVTDPLVGRELGGRYKVRRLIGRGGMGAVYESEAPDGRRVAAKVIFRSAVGQDDQAVRRFIREARAVTAIQSPHVVKTFELGTDLTLAAPFIIMELLSGVDLAKLLRVRGPLEPGPVLRVFLQAARGLAAAHAEGIVHRDIKPANLFLHAPPDLALAAPPGRPGSVRPPPMPPSSSDRRVGSVRPPPISSERRPGSVRPPPLAGERRSGSVRPPPGAGDRTIVVKVCDFGIAKRSDDRASHDLTRAGGVLGSPIYMSPEQAKMARDVDRRSDIWSLSISLYQALCGACPWDPNASLAELLLAICSESVPPLGEAAPWLDPALVADVHRGLRKDPAERWQTMDEMIAALARHTGGGDAVTLDQLRGIDPERRATATPVSKLRRGSKAAAPSGEGAERSIDGSSFPAAEPPRTAARRRVVGAAVALSAVAAIGGVVMLRSSGGVTDGPTASQPAAATTAIGPAPDAVATFTATVAIPPDAAVRVDGVPREVASGRLTLTGKAGDMFEVELSRNGAKKKEKVFLLNDGKMHPDRIDLQADPPAVSVASSADAARRDGPRRPPPSSKSPTSTAAPAAVAPPTAVVPVDRW